MRRRLLLGFLSVTTFVLVVLEVPLGVNYARHERARVIADVLRDGTVLASFAEDGLEKKGAVDLGALVRRYAAQTGARTVILDARGISVADSAPTLATPEDFTNRPEVMTALAGNIASGSRFSKTLGTTLVYVAVPVASGGIVRGVVRITYPAGDLDARVLHNWLALGAIAFTILLAAGSIGWAVARSLSRPVAELERVASELAGGRLDARAPDVRSVHELRVLAHAFNDMASRIEQLVSSQQQFVADASHELRTPLTSLQLRLENVNESAAAGQTEDVEGALRDVRRLRRIVDGLLTLARTEAGEVARATADVNEIVEDRVAAWGPVAAERHVTLHADVRSGVRCSVVPGSLERILDNLISNAVEASPARATIEVRAQRTHDDVTIHVVDHGTGMTEQQRARAFDRFWRADPGGGGGSGLGLAIVRQLVAANGGSVELRDTPGGGLDVIVTLHSVSDREPAAV